MSLTAGETFAGFRIMGRIGAGDISQGYLAQDLRTSRRDALHVMSPELTTDPQYRDLFAHDADLAATLSHPNIPDVYQWGEADGQLWVATEYVEGISAADLMRDRYRGGMPQAEVLAIVRAVASALDHAHRSGLLHRDVKPSNIVVSEPGSPSMGVHLMGLGIARRLDHTPGLTASDTDLDTVAHASPELLIGEDVDGRSDQYALAGTAFHLLTGSWPYPSTNAAVIINKHVMAPPPSIAASRVEFARLDGVFATAMAKDPRGRYPSCQDFAAELERRLLLTPPDGEASQDNDFAETTVAAPIDSGPAAAAGPAPTQPGAPLRAPLGSRTRVRIRNRWWRGRFASEPWSRRKIMIAALASIGILALVGTTLAAMMTPLLMRDAAKGAPRTTAPTPTPATPPVIGRPLAVRPVLDVPLQPRPDQCPAVPPPVPAPPQEPLQACAVDNTAVYQLGPVALQLNLTGATSAKVPTSEFHTVQMSMDPNSSAAFAQYTAANVGKQLAFIRDGVVLAAPSITQPIDGDTLQISGELSAETAGSIARLLRDGT